MEMEKDISAVKNSSETKERLKKESEMNQSTPVVDSADKKNDAAAREEKEKKSAAIAAKKDKGGGPGQKKYPNNLRVHRIEQMMSKAELARKAGLSVLTIDRIEKGYGCRMDTMRKILKALGLKLSDRSKVFKDE